MKFAEFVDISELQELCESFSALSGAVTAILDLEGTILVATGWQEICSRFHRVNPLTARRCTESDTILAGQLKKGETYNVYKCKNGLVDVAMPIIVDGEHVANFFTGQFFFHPPDVEPFIAQAEEFGFDTTSYLEALHKVPVFSEQQVRTMLEFFMCLARIIGEMGFAGKRREESNSELRKHQEHLHDLVKEQTAELSLMNERLFLATKAARIGVWDWDIPKNELAWDDSMYRLYGLQKGEFGGAYDAWASTIHPEDRARIDGEIQAALRGEREYGPEFRIVRPDGVIRHIKADSQTFRDEDDKPLRMIGTNIDITERKQAEEELDRLNEELEQRVRERTKELEQRNHELEQMNKAFVGREMKMVELKERIKELESKR
jgi:PAS domain S-box-containing protein